MIATPSMPTAWPNVAQKPGGCLRLMDAVKDEAAMELQVALDGISGKKIDAANVPNTGKYALSRAANGDVSNPLYRVVGLFVLMKRLGLSRSRAQRIVDWLQEIVDALWPEDEADLAEVLDTEQELDGLDDAPQLRAVRGCVDSMREMLEVKRQQRAHDLTVILTLRQRIAESR